MSRKNFLSEAAEKRGKDVFEALKRAFFGYEEGESVGWPVPLSVCCGRKYRLAVTHVVWKTHFGFRQEKMEGSGRMICFVLFGLMGGE